MDTTFRTVFDLTAQPDAIQPAYWFYAVFWIAGLILSALAWLSVKDGWRSRRFLPVFAVFWVIFCGIMTVVDVRDTSHIRNIVKEGRIEKLTGCLDYFRPGTPRGSKTTAGNEEWSVDGVVFSYGAGEVRPAYHTVSTAGGIIRPDSRVRVYFVYSQAYRRREIVKLDVAEHSCSPARRVEPFAQP